MAYRSCHHESWRRATGAQMTISGKYELIQPVRAAGFRSFYARHVLTGQQVMVHFLNQSQRFEPRPPAAEPSAQGPSASGAQVLDAGTYENTPFLVTLPVEDFTSLAAWLESVAPARRSAVSETTQALTGQPAAPLPPQRPQTPVEFREVTPRRVESLPAAIPASAPSGPGEFTAMFGGPFKPQVPASAPIAPIKIAGPSAADPGGFTGIFGAPLAPAPPAPLPAQPTYRPATLPSLAPPPSPAPPPAPAASISTDEFAQMFLPEDRGPLPAAPIELARPAPSPALAPASPAGEFTMLFSGQASSGATSAPVPATAALRQPLPPMPMMPSSPVRPVPQPMPSPLPAPSHDAFEGATQVFQGPGAGTRSAPQQSMPMSPSGPGEFTMIMRGGPGGGPPANAFPPASASAPASSGSTPLLPGLTPPALQPPKVAPPSMTGPAISSSGVTAPSFQAPNVQAPAMTAPHMSMPSLPAMPTAAPPAAPAAGGAFSPILAAVLACLGTVALLAIVYVLIKR